MPDVQLINSTKNDQQPEQLLDSRLLQQYKESQQLHISQQSSLPLKQTLSQSSDSLQLLDSQHQHQPQTLSCASLKYGKLYLHRAHEGILLKFEKKNFNLSKIESNKSSFQHEVGYKQDASANAQLMTGSVLVHELVMSIPDFVLEYIIEQLKPFDLIVEAIGGYGQNTTSVLAFPSLLLGI